MYGFTSPCTVMCKVSSGHLLSVETFNSINVSDSEGPDQTVQMRRLI